MRSTPLLLVLSVFIAACQPTSTTPETVEPTADVSTVVVEWKVTPLEDGPYDEPRNQLVLVLTGAVSQEIALGTFSGSFADGRQLSVTPEQGVLLKGIFWFAGSGEEVIVQQPESTLLTVSHRIVEELVLPTDYELKEEIALPMGATVTVAPFQE